MEPIKSEIQNLRWFLRTADVLKFPLPVNGQKIFYFFLFECRSRISLYPLQFRVNSLPAPIKAISFSSSSFRRTSPTLEKGTSSSVLRHSQSFLELIEQEPSLNWTHIQIAYIFAWYWGSFPLVRNIKNRHYTLWYRLLLYESRRTTRRRESRYLSPLHSVPSFLFTYPENGCLQLPQLPSYNFL